MLLQNLYADWDSFKQIKTAQSRVPSWEANRFPAVQPAPEDSWPHSQEPATCPLLSQISPVHAPSSHFLKIHCNTINMYLTWNANFTLQSFVSTKNVTNILAYISHCTFSVQWIYMYIYLFPTKLFKKTHVFYLSCKHYGIEEIITSSLRMD